MPDAQGSERSDLALLTEIAAGDRAAFSVLVRRHGASVRRLAAALTGSDAAADDVAQEVFLSVWRSAETFRGDGTARGWLLTITRNAVRRSTRRRAGQPAQLDALSELATAAGWGVASDRSAFEHALESRDLLIQGFDRLTADDREVLTLVDLEGLSLAATADMFEVELPALKSRLHRARLRLLAAIKEVSA